jgi:hypothetical protein
MELKADVEEVAQVWARAPWHVRICLTFSLILTSTSIASLSETVFKWKGFLLDAINLYRSFISGPVQDLAYMVLQHKPSQEVVDLTLLAGLLAAASFRVAVFHPGRSYARKGEIGAVFTMAGSSLALFSSNGAGYAVWLAGGLIAASFFMNCFFHLRQGGAAALLWFVSVLGPVALVGLLGAVYAGLTR